MTALRFKTAGRHSTSSSSLRWRFWKIVPPSLLGDCGISFPCFFKKIFSKVSDWPWKNDRVTTEQEKKKKHVSINKNRVKRRTLSHQSKAKGAYSSSVGWGFQAWDTLQDSTVNSSIDKAETSLEWQEHLSQLQDTTDALPCHIHLPVRLWICLFTHLTLPTNAEV